MGEPEPAHGRSVCEVPVYYAGNLAVQGDVLLEVLDKKCRKLRLPVGIRRIADDAAAGISMISLETYDVNQVESWKPLLQAQRSELKVYSPNEEECIWLPLSRTGGFDDALSAQDGIRINFDRYDSRFERIQDRELKLQIALSRLLYPVQLSENAGNRYEQLVKNRFRPAMLWLVSGKWNWYGRIPQKAAGLLALKPVDRFLKKELIEKSASCGQPEFTALLSGMKSGQMNKEDGLLIPKRTGQEPPFWQQTEPGMALWQLAEQALYRRKPVMEAFCGRLSFIPVEKAALSAGTDGRSIFYTRQVFLGDLARLYTHILVHCIYLHPFSGRSGDPVFSIACDIAAEYVTDQIFGPDGRWIRERQQVYDFLLLEDVVSAEDAVTAEDAVFTGDTALTADRIYRKIRKLDECTRNRLSGWFIRDSHVFWTGAKREKTAYDSDGIRVCDSGEEPDNRRICAGRWSSAGEGFLQAGEKKAGKQSPGAGHEQEKAELEKRKGHDYRDFLRQFMVLREDRILDLDSYDPVYYTYGLNTYGNIPLVEPLETKEVMRLMELVIVIDTSGSCSGRLVRFFLEETWSVFGQSGNFFNQFHVRILQCDAVVQEDVKLTNLQEAEHYMKNLVIRGGGGTDFRAAFAWIRELQRKGELRHLKGILYFTDGFGTFPAQAPGCRTAFIFLKSRFGQVEVPCWADKLLLELPEGADWEPEYTGGFRGNILR